MVASSWDYGSWFARTSAASRMRRSAPSSIQRRTSQCQPCTARARTQQEKLWRAKLVKQKAAVVHTPHAATEAVPGGAAPIIIDQSGGFELVFDPAHLVHQRKAPPRFEEWKRAKTAAAQQAKQRRAAVEAKQARAVRKQQHKGRIAFDKFLAECDERDAAARQQSQQKRDEAAKEATEAAKRAEEKQKRAARNVKMAMQRYAQNAKQAARQRAAQEVETTTTTKRKPETQAKLKAWVQAKRKQEQERAAAEAKAKQAAEQEKQAQKVAKWQRRSVIMSYSDSK